MPKSFLVFETSNRVFSNQRFAVVHPIYRPGKMSEEATLPIFRWSIGASISPQSVTSRFNRCDMHGISTTEVQTQATSDSLRRLTFSELLYLLKDKDSTVLERLRKKTQQQRFVTVKAQGLQYELFASPISEEWFVVSKHEQQNKCSAGEVS